MYVCVDNPSIENTAGLVNISGDSLYILLD